MSQSLRSLIFGLTLITWIGGSPSIHSQDPTPADTQETTKMAQDSDTRRRESVMMANAALQAGVVFLQAGNWDKADERFSYVLKMTNSSGAGKNIYIQAQQGLAKVYIGRANDAIGQGDLAGAQGFLDKAESLDDKNANIVLTRKKLAEQQAMVIAQHNNPESMVNNPAVTQELIDKVGTIQRLMFEGDRFFETGQYDKADSRFRQILVIDPYNKGARSRLEKIDRYRLEADKIAHNTARDEALYNVDRRWHEVEKPEDAKVVDTNARTSQESNVAKIVDKMSTIKLPELNFNDLPVEDALNQLMEKSRELDPQKEGVNFVIKTKSTSEASAPASAPTATLTSTMVAGANGTPAVAPAPAPAIQSTIKQLHINSGTSLDEALRLIMTLANLKSKVEEYAVFILPVTDTASALITRTFSVPPGFFQGGLTAPSSSGIGNPTIRTGGLNNGAPAGVDSVKIDVKQQLIDQGVEFPNGSTAAFLAGSSKLVVKNTPEQMDFIDALVQARQTEEPQIEIETKYVEFTDTALKELSFNWAMSVLGDINSIPLIEGANGVLQQPTNAYPGLNDIYLPPINGRVQYAGGTANRTQTSIPENGLDELLGATAAENLAGGSNTGLATNQLFLGGVLGGHAYGLIANLIDQLHGVDLLSAPKITVKSRNAGKVEIAREMRYPTNFQAPKFNGSPIQFDGIERVLLLPPTPSDFQTETVGIVLDVTPVAYPDRRIDLDLKPKVTDFEGFINYGSTVVEGRIDGPNIVENLGLLLGIINVIGPVVPNPAPLLSPLGTYKLQQPVFNNRSLNTKIQVIDGQTVVMGGLIREDRNEIEDKVPLLGDLPLAGRLFRSKVNQTIKRNLIIFVTAKLIRPTGKPKFMQDSDDTFVPTMVPTPAPVTSVSAKNP